MSSSSTAVRGPRTGPSITHKVLLQVIDWKKKSTEYYKVMSYKLLESLLRMPSVSHRIQIADMQMQTKIEKELKHFWESDLQQTEDFMRCDLMFVLELNKE